MISLRKTIILALLTLTAVQAWAFDWPVRTNEDLYKEMIAYASSFAESTEGTRTGRILRRFIKIEEKKFAKDEYAWLQDTYEIAKKLEKICPPTTDNESKEAMVRRSILRLIEYPIHEHDRADARSKTAPGNQDPVPEQRKAFEEGRDWYRHNACAQAVEWLGKPAPKAGELGVFRVYNMGYIFRTENRCFAIDLGREMPDVYCKALADKLDVIFLTHPHGDHYWAPMLKAMLDAGKKVFLPKDVIQDYPSEFKTVMWDDVLDEPLDVCGIKVKFLAGNQSDGDPSAMPNNIYHLCFDGWTVNHSGDNYDRVREARMGELECPDVAVFASWNNVKTAMDAIKACPDFNKSKVTFFPSHENEFWHRVMQRESWWEDFTRVDRYADPDYDYLPCTFLDNGEGTVLRK